MYPPMKTGNIYAEKGSAVHVALEKWANAKLGLEEDADVDYEKVLKEYYAETGLWKLDNRPPGKGHTHPVEKSCESCPWATKDGLCEISNRPIVNTEGCPRPNFQEDLDLTSSTLVNPKYNPLKLVKDNTGGEVFEKKILGVEHKFEMKLGGIPVRGVMDLVFEEDDETLEVCDYKTGRAMSYNKAMVDAQVRIYGAVARILWPQYKHIMVTLWYVKFRPVTVCLSAEDDEMTIKSLRKNFNEIAQNQRPRRSKNWLCNYCVGYDTCGEIYNNLRVDGKFRLPIISCNYSADEGDCWGSIHPVDGQQIGPEDVKEIVYVCKGHKGVAKGKEYVAEDDAPKTFR